MSLLQVCWLLIRAAADGPDGHACEPADERDAQSAIERFVQLYPCSQLHRRRQFHISGELRWRAVEHRDSDDHDEPAGSDVVVGLP
jgi:hypothetical protein